jgi:hypothetical protein
MEIPLLSESDEEIWSGLSECDECVDECIAVSLKMMKKYKEWHCATKPLELSQKRKSEVHVCILLTIWYSCIFISVSFRIQIGSGFK